MNINCAVCRIKTGIVNSYEHKPERQTKLGMKIQLTYDQYQLMHPTQQVHICDQPHSNIKFKIKLHILQRHMMPITIAPPHNIYQWTVNAVKNGFM